MRNTVDVQDMLKIPSQSMLNLYKLINYTSNFSASRSEIHSFLI